MPNKKRMKVHYTLSSELLPEVMDAKTYGGTFWVSKQTDEVWYCSPTTGAVVSLVDLLNRAQTVAPPRVGDKGDSIKGDKGDRGEPGRDSIVPGPKGDRGDPGRDSTVPGPVGPAGKCECSDKLSVLEQRTATAIQKANAVSAQLSDLLAQVAELRLQIDACNSSIKVSADYVAFLRKRVADRLAQQKG